MKKYLLLILILLSLALSVVIGVSAPSQETSKSLTVAKITPVDDAWRAALPRDPEAATQAYMARLSPAAIERSDAYFEGGYWLQWHNFALATAIALLLLWSKTLVHFRERLEKRIKNNWLLNALTVAYYTVLTTLLSMPLTVYQGFYREKHYGMSNMALGAWFGEQMMQLMLAVLFGAIAFATLYVALKRAPKTWWAWGAGLSVGFMTLMLLIAPTYIDPLFNKYTPITDAKIKDPIMSMMRANGVPTDNIYQFNASKQTTRISANVSGIFGSASVRLNDNLLNRTTLPEIKAVLGHELGHYVLNHIYKMLLAFAFILVIGFALVQWGMNASLARWGQTWQLKSVSDIGSLPLLMTLFAAYMTLATPLTNTMIRVNEVEADIFGLNASGEAMGFAEVNLSLTEYRKSNPSDLEEFLFFDHPSPRKRIYSAMRWRAEHMPAESK